MSAVTVYYILTNYGKKVIGIAAMLLILTPGLFISYFIISNPQYAQVPYADKSQMIDDWPSGGGIKEVNKFLLSQSQKGKIAVFTDGTFGLLPAAIEIYLVDNPNVEIHGLWPLPQEIPAQILGTAMTKPTYFVLNQAETPPPWPLRLIAVYKKGNRSDRHLRFYEIVPSLRISTLNNVKI